MFSDNKDFYPTPRGLFSDLIDGKRWLGGRILEPSAGKGDMVRYIRDLSGRGDNVRIDAIESDPRLSNILASDGVNVVWDDFLTYETYKEYDYIIMNPPFSSGVDHVLKALELAENQLSRCEIYAILNKETINNAYTDKRQALLRKLEEHGADMRYVQGGFTAADAERKTDVEVAMIHATIEKAGAGKAIYDKIPFAGACKAGEAAELSTALATYVAQGEMQAKINDIERLVLEYETACELARDTFKAVRDKESFFSYIDTANKGSDGYSRLSLITAKEFTSDDLNEELDRLRRGYWALILDTDEFKTLLTNEAIQKLNRQMSAAESMEINMPNIKMLLAALGANREDMLLESVVAIFKRITKHHMNQYSTNIHYYDGWKTNNAYKINKKVIVPIKWGPFESWDFAGTYDRLSTGVRHFIDDLVKAFQLIDPQVPAEFEPAGPQEFENELLRFKMFKNGNIHVWFKDLALLNKFNYLCGRQLNWIPGEEEQKADAKARAYVAREFGDLSGGVRLLAKEDEAG